MSETTSHPIGTEIPLTRYLATHTLPLGRIRANERHYRLKSEDQIVELIAQLLSHDYYLVSLVGNDERELEDNCFKLYYLFSHPHKDEFITLETLLGNSAHPLSADQPVRYKSVYHALPAVRPFERELADLLGLQPEAEDLPCIFATPATTPYPLQRTRLPVTTLDRSAVAMTENFEVADEEYWLPVGPVHAGIIEPGRFYFRLSSEEIEELRIRLGYTHRGLEYLFQKNYKLLDGWKLAEEVAGDSSFAHSLAYCHAVETLAECVVPETAQLLRGLFLELERIANHVNDTAMLAHDLSLDISALEIAFWRENLLRLNQELTGSRFLRGLNRPGGVMLRQKIGGEDLKSLRNCIIEIVDNFFEYGRTLIKRPIFRERVIGLGVLDEATARHLGVTGFVARASGLNRNYRLQHPSGIYAHSAHREALHERIVKNKGYSQNGQNAEYDDFVELYGLKSKGDVFTRFLWRLQEINVSVGLVDYFCQALAKNDYAGEISDKELHLERMANFEYSIGYAEGWRGDIIYWIMKDRMNRIYRCKVRDPSTLNWPGLEAAVAPGTGRNRTMLTDFPVINKSFNLSYCGNDL
jgi:Ni,Fe-hydrogenase III large subunit/Ni,Fe-hydrogenase III component G